MKTPCGKVTNGVFCAARNLRPLGPNEFDAGGAYRSEEGERIRAQIARNLAAQSPDSDGLRAAPELAERRAA
jgi:hypothetical protein